MMTSTTEEHPLETIQITVTGMSCAACVASVKNTVERLDGVHKADVNLATGRAVVTHDPARVNVDDIMREIRRAGFDAALPARTARLKIEGMSCAACLAAVERAMEGVPGTSEVNVNLFKGQASLRYDSSLVDTDDILDAVRSAGYDAFLLREDEEGPDEAEKDRAQVAQANARMRYAWILTVPIIVAMVPEMFWGIAWPTHMTHHVGMTILSGAVILWPGLSTLRSGLRSALHRAPTMDTLIFLGTVFALITGPLSFVMDIANYAGVGAMIMAIHLTGRSIESRARGRASQAIRELLDLEADTASVLVDGEERLVEVDELVPSDVMVVRPGEKIPTDGKVVRGTTSVDQSMATGESMPVTRGEGDEVIGSTINVEGLIHVQVTRVGGDTFLAQVIKLVEEAQTSRIPIQALADRITHYFVPAISLLALVTFIAWMLLPDLLGPIVSAAAGVIPWVNPEASQLTLALSAMIATLVIACPCALGLATPTALMVGSGKGAQHGVLIRRGEAIQAMKNIAVIVFDKTGTITRGEPRITEIVPAAGVTEEELLTLTATVERGSEHPLGRAVVLEASERDIETQTVDEFAALTGRGVSGRVGGRRILVGTERLLAEQDIGLDDDLASEKERLEGEARTVMITADADEGRSLGLIAVADPPKDDSRSAIQKLHEMGFETAVLTGDNRRTAMAMAREVGIDRVVAEVLPDGKVDEIRRLQEEVGPVAMVGDGINDAPALTQADVGIALGTGTDVAIESSDVTLVRGDLSAVVAFVNVSRATFSKIQGNLFWAFFYNVIAIPVAMLGLLHPVIAEAAMAVSSITVVTNANLLHRLDPRPEYERSSPGRQEQGEG